MKYQVGDKVLVNPDLEVGKRYGNNSFVSEMLSLKGKIVTISDIKYGFYLLKEDLAEKNWTDEMFLPINKYNIGDKVLVRSDLEEGKKYGDEVVMFDMLYFKGKIVTIEHVDYPNHYRIKEDPDQWHWTDEMFFGKEPEEIKSDLEEIEEYFDSNEIYNPIIEALFPYCDKVTVDGNIVYSKSEKTIFKESESSISSSKLESSNIIDFESIVKNPKIKLIFI